MFTRRFPKFPLRSIPILACSSVLVTTVFLSCQAENPADMVFVVQDLNGNPISNAEVITADGRTHSDASGRVILARPSSGRGFVSVQAEGYAPYAFVQGQFDLKQIPLLSQGVPVSFKVDQAVDVVAADQVRITMDSGALVDKNGNPVTGQAQVTVVPIDPHGPQQNMIPLPQAQVAGNDEPLPLQSVFMADISLWQNGSPIRLAPGKTATVEMLLPESVQNEYEPGATLDGFWFDVDAGIWKKGTLGLVMPSTLVPGKKSWIASVEHFTFWGPADIIWNPGDAGVVAGITKHCVNVTTKDTLGNPIGGIRIQALGLDYPHTGAPSYTNWTDVANLGQACLELKAGGKAQLIPSHPASYKIASDPAELTVGPDPSPQNRACTNGLQKHANVCPFTVEIMLTLCGNGIVQPGEACDDGNTNNSDSCTQVCSAPKCGDGFVQVSIGESCDDGNTVSGDGCQDNCMLPTCNDGVTDLNEQCDDGVMGVGNGNQDDGCTDLCQFPYCGDGYTQPSKMETCDDSNGDNDDLCTTLCKAPACGDGFLQPLMLGEQCDNGPANSNTGVCKLNCQNQKCGDGFVGPSEQCDDANQNNEDSCTTLCKAPFCGDGIIELSQGEQCDNGIANSNTGACKLNCKNQICGDGFVGPSEQCDDANVNNDDGCTQICKPPFCGDGFKQVSLGEACDDGNANNNDACTQLCKAPFCGDGFIQPGEQCDNAGANANNAACKANCQNQVCGDGYVGPGEQCDDGNGTDNDGCRNNCTSPSCGDGVTQMGSGEQCDDANLENDDTCTNVCLTPKCGDGIKQVSGMVTPVEQCDDGNADNTDSCTQLCKAPFCGDGFLQVANGEQCDDGNASNVDACTNACKPAACGDGFIQAGEACDDGNQTNGDGCETNCQLTPGLQAWAAPYNGVANGQDRGYGVATDASGNVVVTGIESVTGQGFNVWTRKYTSTGAQSWSKTYNNATANGDDLGYGVAFAPNGNVIVTGVQTVTGQGYDIFVLCYDTAGTQLWTDTYNNAANNGFDIGYNVAVDNANNVFVVGTETVGAQTDLWLRKYNSTGVIQWTKTNVSFAGYTTNQANVAIAGNGDVIVTGYESDLMGVATNDKILYLRYNTAGTLLAGSQLFNGSYYALSTAVDTIGNILVTGFRSTVNDDVWVAKYTNTGGLLWESTYTGPAGADRGLDIASDGNNNVLVSGFETVAGQGQNFWIRKYSSGGTVGWTNTYNAAANGNDIANGITADASGNVLVTGYVAAVGQSQNVWTIKYSP